jgi:uncharacterized protein (DUF983 family)
MDGRELAQLRCTACGLETEHSLRYAGRLLVSTHCGNCGATWHHQEADLRHAYIHDLESRVWSKPGRWVARLRRHPLETLVALPVAIVAQPIKIAREVITVIRG